MTGINSNDSILKAFLLIIISILMISNAFFTAFAESENFFDSSVFADRPGYEYDKFDKAWSYRGASIYWVDKTKEDVFAFLLQVDGDDKKHTVDIKLFVGCFNYNTLEKTDRGKPSKVQFLINDEVLVNVQLPFSGSISGGADNAGAVCLGENGLRLCEALTSINSLSIKISFSDNSNNIIHDFSKEEISELFEQRTEGNDSLGYMIKKLLETDIFFYNTIPTGFDYTDDSEYIIFENEEANATETTALKSTSNSSLAAIQTAEDESENNHGHEGTDRQSGLFSYSIKGNGTVSISDYDWSKSSGDIYIPAMLDGYAVTAIGDEAFANGKNENQDAVLISIPDSVTIIGEKAFYNSPVSTVSIPASVKAIGKAAFAYCDITQFIVDQQQPNYATIDGVLYDKRNRTLLAHPQKKSITSRIPEGIQSIGEYAFSGMTIGQNGSTALCLTDILPSTLTKIEAHAFENCTLYYSTNNNQSGVIYYNSDGNEMNWLPANVTMVDEYAFAGCTFRCKSYSSPESIVIGEKIEEIGDYAFSGCRFYDGFDFDLFISRSDIERIGKSAFASSVMYSNENGKMNVRIQLPEAIEEIDENAFFETHPVCIREGTEIRSVSEAAFRNSIVYSEMKKEKYQDAIPISLSIPGKMKTIPSSAFAYRLDDDINKVEKIDIQDGVRKIGDSAFAGRKSLKTVSIPMTVTEIGDQAFTGCQNIKEVSIPESVTEIGDNAFERQFVTLIVKEDSYAALWASENGYNFRYEETSDSLDWLNSDIH